LHKSNKFIDTHTCSTSLIDAKHYIIEFNPYAREVNKLQIY